MGRCGGLPRRSPAQRLRVQRLRAQKQRGKVDPSSHLLQSIQHRLYALTNQHAAQPIHTSLLTQGMRGQQQRVAQCNKRVIEAHVRQRSDSQRNHILATGETLQALTVQEPSSPTASLENEQVIAMQNSGDEAAFAPIGRSGMQVGIKKMPVGRSRCLAQSRRDAAGGRPVRLCHHLSQFPVQTR